MKYKSGDTVILLTARKTGMPIRYLGLEFTLSRLSKGYPEIAASGDTVWVGKCFGDDNDEWHIAESMVKLIKASTKLDNEIHDIQTMGYRE